MKPYIVRRHQRPEVSLLSAAYEPQGSIPAILRELCQSAGLEGVAIVDRAQPGEPVTYSTGLAGAETLKTGRALLAASPNGPSHTIATDRRAVLACPWVMPPTRPGGLVMWRAPGRMPWTTGDHALAASVAMLMRQILSSGFGQIGIDQLTGIPNRRWFLDEAERRIDRLEHDNVTGTLSLIDIDDLKRLNDRLGRQTGDRLLIRLASHLRAAIRPADLIARVGDDEFAIWQDGMDYMTAAERADALCAVAWFDGLVDGVGVAVSIGIASRPPNSGEDVRTLLRRAHMAAREVKAAGGGTWRVAHAQPASGRGGRSE